MSKRSSIVTTTSEADSKATGRSTSKDNADKKQIGSKAYMDRSQLKKRTEAKMEMLEVAPETLQAHGAVSSQTAKEMAEGALAHSQAALSVSVTGIAGPGGGSADKPVGLVWFGLAQAGKPTRTVSRTFGDVGRERVRALTVEQALKLLIDALS